jgi:hypothetical protein
MHEHGKTAKTACSLVVLQKLLMLSEFAARKNCKPQQHKQLLQHDQAANAQQLTA